MSTPAIELEVDYLVYKDNSGAEVVKAVSKLGVPVGGICSFAMPKPPDGWLICDGSNNLLISDFQDLYTAISLDINCSVGNGSGLITINDPNFDTSMIPIGAGVSGTNIPNGSTVTQLNSANTFSISNAATGTNTANILVHPWGLGTTANHFKIPDLRGQFLRMWPQGYGSSSLHFAEHQKDGVRPHRHDNWNMNARHASWYNVHDGDLDGSWVATGYDKVTRYGGSDLSFHDGKDAHGNFGDSGIGRSGVFRDDTRPYNYSVQYCIKF